MSYAAVISLKHTINSLSNHPPFSSNPQILTLAFDRTKSLQQLLERRDDSSKSSSRSLDALEGQIRDFSNKLEDALEFHESNPQIDFALDEVLRQEIHSFAEAAKKMEKDYLRELSREEGDGDDDAAINAPSLYIDSGVEMIGRSHEFATISDFLLRRMRPDDLFFFSFFGEVGSGRTMMAKAVFDATKHDFDCCAWATVGSKPDMKEVLMTIIAQVDNSAADGHGLPISREDEELRDYLYKILVNRRYMIVLDDVGELEQLDYVGRSLPDQSTGSALIFTTSSMELTQVADHSHTSRVHSRDFDELVSFSLHLLICGSAETDYYATVSPGLKEAGEKIFENCRGNSVALAKTLFFLMKSEKTVEQWRKIAADKENPVFMVGDEISEINKIKREMQSPKWVVDEQVRNMCVEWISRWVDGSYCLDEIKTQMYPERFFPRMQIICVLGMTGIGKSTLVRKIFDDESSRSYFDYHVWITLGQEYHAEDILIDVLAQIYPDIDKMHIKGDEKSAMELCAQLSGETKRCLIVLDDLCCNEPLYHLKDMFPDIMGTTIVTTRLAKVGKSGKGDYLTELKLMDNEQSWCLLRHKVFVEGSCPPELEKAGRQIAEKCDGLPLLIIKVAEQLLKVEMSEEYWSNVATGKQKSVFMNAHSQISHMVLPSYLSLPQHLKACFLYLGVFHEKYEVLKCNLTNLWVAERFLEPPNSPKGITYSIDENSGSRVINIWSAEGLFELNSPKTIEDIVDECISELDDRSLVMIQRKVSDFQIKTCRLHAIFWHLSNNQAVKNKFFHAMNSYDDCSLESVKTQRRLCIRNSVLLGIEDVRNSISSNTSAHSLLCVSPLHQYPVPVYFDLRLLRVMNALTIRLYEFPIEVVGLFHLRYLSLTCNGKLPSSISDLRKLQFLIVKRYMNIKLSEASSLLPVEIWDMKELKHLQVTGGSLPSHKRGDGLLNLSTLLDVSAQTCREDVLKWIPNLKRLGIQIELGPGDEGNSFHYLNNIHHLLELESLKCVVVNPRIRLGDATSFAPILHFPPNLQRLSLSGFGYPWKHMHVIGELKNLQVLKLKQYAFQGPKWDVDYTSQFKKLKFLLLEDTNLECWKISSPMSLTLERLCIKHCYKLKEMPSIVKLSDIRLVHVFDCNPLILSWAKQTKRRYKDILNIHLSWIEGTAKTHSS